MRFQKESVAETLRRWERFMGSFALPEWNELPQIGLYMDQVIALVDQYLGFLVYDPAEQKLLTPSMVNNYVKMRLLPPPVKKRYARKHIALLIMICTFKHALGMADVSRMLPYDDEAEIRAEYERFSASFCRISDYVVHHAKESAAPIFDESSDTGTEVADLIVGAAVAAGLARLLAGKLILLGLPQESAEAPPNETQL